MVEEIAAAKPAMANIARAVLRLLNPAPETVYPSPQRLKNGDLVFRGVNRSLGLTVYC
jgi:hypothetical protein